MRESIALEQKGGLSTLETSERYVGKMDVCVSGVAGAYIPSLGRKLPEEVSPRQKRCGEMARGFGGLLCL